MTVCGLMDIDTVPPDHKCQPGEPVPRLRIKSGAPFYGERTGSARLRAGLILTF